MRFLSAPLIFPIHKSPIEDGILVIEDNGKIVDLLDSSSQISADQNIEKFDGILCPGFINTHCHLELSHLKGKFSQKKQLPHFISEIIALRNANEDIILESMQKADDEMLKNGIVAVGDISNTFLSSVIKKKSKIYYHTFVEIFDLNPARSQKVFEDGIALRDSFSSSALIASLVPHSPYTVSPQLLKLIADESLISKLPVCIHNQETAGENEMFEKGSGSLLIKLREINEIFQNWKPYGKSSLQFISEYFSAGIKLQLVHNTFTDRDDLLKNKFLAYPETPSARQSIFYCMCPNANLYIENRLPDINLFTSENCKITTGTDSYASNHSLSILDELTTIASHFPDISIDQLLSWATINGAQFLGIDEKSGSFEKGKFPGVNHIQNINRYKPVLSQNCFISRVV